MDQMMISEELIGLSTKEAEILLGQPEWYTWDDIRKQHDSSKWNYGLGIKPGAFNTNKSNALIVFENGKLVEISSYDEALIYTNTNE